MDNAGTLDLPRVLGLARAIRALVEGGSTSLARPLAAELVAALEKATGDGAAVVSLDAERSRRGR